MAAPAASPESAASAASAASSATVPAQPTTPNAAPTPTPVLWYDLPTPAGRFTLSPVKPDRDLPLIALWMNDPAVAAHWGLDGPPQRTADHVRAQLALAHTTPLLARLSGRPIGYWELYRAAADPLAAYYDAEPDDLGVHLLIGEADCRGIGLGGLLLRALADAAQRQKARRLVAEPDARNTASVRAFARAGFAAAGTLDLPDKRATLMLRPAPAPAAAPADPGEDEAP
jgi:RimJ/RimL family protein N-acetyltransferase